jgi:5-formyltetrahydrofolate cyclo-ligase
MKDGDKKKIREQFVSMRGALTEDFIAGASLEIIRRLSGFEALKNTENICAFFPSYGEPRIIPFLEKMLGGGKKIFLPKYSQKNGNYAMAAAANFADSLAPGKFGIMEPIGNEILSEKSNRSTAWLVPGIAFDKLGMRIGYGKGIYDILLETRPELKVGICYQRQIVGRIEPESHDVKMNYIFTEEEIYKVRASCKTQKTKKEIENYECI